MTSLASLLRSGLTLGVLLAGVALAQPAPTPRDLREAERAAAERRRAADGASANARALAEEELRLADRRIAAATRAQSTAVERDAAAARLAAAVAAGQRAAAGQATAAAALRPLLPVMLRLSLWPAETVLAVPGEPEDALRGALVLRGLARRLDDQAAALRSAEAQFRAAEALARREAERLVAGERAAQDAEAEVDRELGEARQRRGAAEVAEERAASRAAEAAARATDLAEVLARLDRERQRRETEARENAVARATEQARREAEQARERRLAAAQPAPPPPGPPDRQQASAPVMPPAQGGRALPVAGRVTLGWGDSGAAGPHRGLTYAATVGARVVSPCDGRTVYAAPFRSFGPLLIVDCGGGTHFVLAGMSRLDTVAGQRVLAGEPVGVLGSHQATPGASAGSLYVELRRNGQPVDPRPWFAARS